MERVPRSHQALRSTRTASTLVKKPHNRSASSLPVLSKTLGDVDKSSVDLCLDRPDFLRTCPERLWPDDANRALAAAMVKRIHVIGDCHGCRTFALMSNKVVSHFHGGSIYSWISDKRTIPLLSELIGFVQGGIFAVVFSYGEIDCRSHTAKIQGRFETLSVPYVAKIRAYIDAFITARSELCKTSSDVHIVPIVLAVPPPADQGHNPAAPFRGSLLSRIAATDGLNAALKLACEERGIAFTGLDTWDFAKNRNGALERHLSDGHVNIESRFCGSVQRRVLRLIVEGASSGSRKISEKLCGLHDS